MGETRNYSGVLMGYLKERKIFKLGHRWASGIRMYCREREWKDMN